ncbi:hypothetical protein OU995_16425 [Roseateles sp. SL47]|uniref:hypothetical protein n=1 Tax=Roseateles sp. SL47 TaxID=2995138 RepID=UPI002270B710|nr:hypothetical protein [Roseateles sp. SL47]WAC71179.1 hypothetical protein OU995_16425 [Roseateles sp. SL47]
MPSPLAVDSVRALVGWRATEERWQAFWDHWSGAKIRSEHWLRRDLASFNLSWFGGELELELAYEGGTLTVDETWALRSMRLNANWGQPLRLNWGWDIDPSALDLASFEQKLAVTGRRHVDGASFFLSRSDGVELAIQLDWFCGHSGPLKTLSIAALGTAKG